MTVHPGALRHTPRHAPRHSPVALAVALVLASAAAQAQVALPVPCATGSCGPTGPNTHVTSGAAAFTQVGNAMTITQTTASATLNWQSFNIGSGGSVTFVQPDASSVALNRIFQADPARILGSLTANGRVYLLNRNGIVFGQGAQVNVRGLLASTLDLSPEALELGLARAASVTAPALQQYVGPGNQRLVSGAVTVENGATITANGGQVLLFAPEVTNRGSISTPDGQTILGAGQRIFLAASDDPDLRGLLVEVGDGGTVTNGDPSGAAPDLASASGRIMAERGNVTLAGIAVNQNGRVSATTSVRANGSIRLIARDTNATRLSQANFLEATRTGDLTLGQGSRTEVLLDTDTATSVDVNAQRPSFVEMQGRNVSLLQGAAVVATGGDVDITATTNPNGLESVTGTPDGSRLYLANGARIDVSGATASLAMERNSLRVELRGSQLADSPVQRDGPLRAGNEGLGGELTQAVYVDVRQSGTRADGSFWRGSPIGDLSGDVATIARDVRERNLNGGDVRLSSQGAVLIDDGATIDLSGGRINWASGYVRSSYVLGADGRAYNIAAADRDRAYLGLLDGQRVQDRRWGTAELYNLQGIDPRGQYEAGYVEGHDAGSLTIAAPRAVVGGNIVGSVITGPNQRQPTQAGPAYQPYGAYNVVPKGPRLEFGLAGAIPTPAIDFALFGVTFADGPGVADLRNADGSAFDPRRDPLPSTLRELYLSPTLINAAGASSLAIYANGAVTLPAGTTLNLARGGELLVRGGNVTLDGVVNAPGGAVRATARQTVTYNNATAALRPTLSLGSGARLNLQGEWVNDRLALQQGALQLPPAYLNGGTAELSADDGLLQLAPGSVVDVSGGARRQADGSIAAGRAGSITLAARLVNGATAPSLQLGAELRGYALQDGGTLSINAPSACISAAACADPLALQLAPALFSSGGFRNYGVTTTLGDLRVAGDAQLQLQSRNWLLSDRALNAATGTAFASLVELGTLPEAARRPVNLSLSANQTINPFPSYGDLVVEAGAVIAADPRATLNFSSNSRVLFDGTARTAGGTVNFNLTPTLGITGFLADQGIWLGSTARVDVNGRAVLDVRQDGRRTGTVLDGGTVNFDAARGYLMLLPGAVVTANGASEVLDLQRRDGSFDRQSIASRGGTVRLSTTEGLQMGATLSARGGDATAAGGTLEVLIDNRRSNDPDGLLGLSARRIVVTAGGAPTVVNSGLPVPGALNGIAQLPAEVVAAGGFDFLSLTARDVLRPINGTQPTAILNQGSVTLQAGVALAPRGRLVLDASSIVLPGAGPVGLTSSYVRLGSTDTLTQSVVAAQTGGGTLDINAGLLDLVGQVGVVGAGTTRITATNGVRLQGVFRAGGTDFVAAARFAGDVRIATPQLYASTLTDATFSVLGGTLGLDAAGTRTPILSAGSRLTLNADRIDVGTRVAAPGGALTLRANDVLVRDGGTLSVALEGTTLFGRVQGGFSWVYELPNGGTRVYDGTAATLPEKSVSIDAGTVTLAPGSTIDVAGGGDLLAFEFVPGPGGTRDLLSAEVDTGQFAVVPGLSLPYAPVDPRESRGTTLRPGDSVWLADAPGLPAGYYTLLPARYALLPGAMLVTPVSGYQDLRPGDAARLTDGTAVVAGYRTVAGTSIRDSRSSGFAVRNGAALATLANYQVATANSFFPAQRGLGDTRLPRDAGSVSLTVGTALDAQGTVRTTPATGGRGAAVDVSAARLRVVGAGDSALAGWVNVVDSQLRNLNADVLILGGRRGAGGTTITPISTDLTLAAGASLTAPRLMLLANGTLTAEAGSSARAAGATAPLSGTTTVNGNAAVVYLDSSRGADLAFAGGVTRPAQLNLLAGSTLGVGPGGAITLSTSGTAAPVVDATLDARGAALRVRADRLTLADDLETPGAGVLQASRLSATGLASLTLEARTQLSLAGNLNATFTDFGIVAPRVVATRTGSNSTITADTIRLAGTGTVASVTSGSSALTLQARSLSFGGGQLAFGGLGDVTLGSNSPVALAGSGALVTAGNLQVNGGFTATQAGVDADFSAGGRLAVAAAPGAVPANTSALGARLRLAGSTVDLNAPVLLSSGELDIRAANGVTLGGAARVDLAARSLVVDSLPLALPGGTLRIETAAGDVTVDSASRVLLDGTAGGAGGRLALIAANGTVRFDGQASAAGGRGGELLVDARAFTMADAVRVAGNGFNGAVSLRQRGAGDLVLDAGQALSARSINLLADGGGLTVNGTLTAAASDGRITLGARDVLQVNGTLNAGTVAALDDPGLGRASVQLASDTAVRLGSGSTVNLHGGELRARLPEAVVLGAVNGGNGLRLDGQLVNAANVIVEGYRRYEGVSTIGSADVAATAANARYAAATAFIDATTGRGTAIGAATGQDVRFTPGIDLVSDGDLQLAADWNLSTWRYRGVAPTVTLRAAGDLLLDGSLSDGFASLAPGAGFSLPQAATDSASLRLVAGADLTSVDALAVRRGATGDVRVGEGVPFDGFNPPAPRLVRTGTGSIDIAAAGNLVLANQASVIYTAGVRGAGINLADPQSIGGLGGLAYPERGGDIRIAVGGDVIGAQSNQLYTDWLWRTGSRASDTIAPRPTAWSVSFQNFEQGIAAFGGGTVAIEAGGSIRDLNVSLPSIGRQVGGTTVAANRVVETGGGALRVRAGGDILGGTYYVGRGDGSLVAGGRIDAADPASLFSLAPVLAVGSGGISVQARQQVAIETIVNPTLLGQSRLFGEPLPSYFSTYTDQSRAALTSVGRAVTIGTDTSNASVLAAQFPFALYNEDAAARTLPPSLRVIAPSDSITVGGSISLWPAQRGDLTLIAGRDVNFAPRFGGPIQVIMSDAAVGRDLPTPDRPSEVFDPAGVLLTAFNASPSFYSPTPVHGAGDGVAADPEPVRIIAMSGDVSFQADSPSTFSTIFLAKRARILAGRDIVSLGLRAQHVSPGDVTTISAGRDITYPLVRTRSGQVSTIEREITVGGSGELQLVAGRDINLQTSRGITTEGALRNPALSATGANVSLVAGESGRLPAFDAFIDRYLAGSDAYTAALIAYIARLDGAAPVDKAAALARFRSLDRDSQRPLLQAVLTAEVRAGGRVAASSPNQDYSRAFAALTTYYPGSNPDLAKGETNPYSGDVRLYFSRVYTLAGGDVSVLAPGGEVNVGLATPPTSFGIRKTASDLGIVVQGDGSVSSIGYGNFQVNESRVIAGNGGNILVWSTQGDIDAGRGAKTAISAPPPQITIDEQGQPKVVFPAAFTGSGIQTLATTPGRRPGNVDLFAPRGVVDAGDAGIVAGNLTIAATAVLGAGNISVSGTSVGVPVDTGGLGASLAGASGSAAGASNAGADLAAGGGKDSTSNTPLADTALNWLDVFVVGLGDETCRPDDLECLKRQRTP